VFDQIPTLLAKMTANEQEELFKLLELYKQSELEQKAATNFMSFVQ
jgi:hypothetical protein